MNFKDNKAIYLQIADIIYENILSGLWTEESKILSVRELASNIEVNPNTVMRTYSELEAQGLIYNKRGVGFYVATGAINKCKESVKAEFVNNYLPDVFGKMEILNITIDELIIFYNQFKLNKNEKK